MPANDEIGRMGNSSSTATEEVPVPEGGSSAENVKEREGGGGGVGGGGLVRQTSMEEESAQALLALNKGIAPAGGGGGGAGGGGGGKGETQKKKKKAKKKRKAEDSVARKPEEGVAQLEDEIPDSQRIISQHLAAHMSKISHPVPMVTAATTAAAEEEEDVATMDAALPAFPTGGEPSNTPSRAIPAKNKGKGKAVYQKKRKRVADPPPDDSNRLVDPALMEIDEATALAQAAAHANISVEVLQGNAASDEPKQKRKRRLPTSKIEQGIVEKKKGWKKGVVVVDGQDAAATPAAADSPDVTVAVGGDFEGDVGVNGVDFDGDVRDNNGNGNGSGNGNSNSNDENDDNENDDQNDNTHEIGTGVADEIGDDTPMESTMQHASRTGGAGGPFSPEEKHIVDTHLARYCREHGFTHDDLCARVWANERRKDDFWEGVCLVLPMRSRASIYKHVRRQYHIFNQRAKWSESEDERLEALVKEKGSSWKAVGDAMGRMGEDCRDRWRNYGKCGKDRGKDRWDESEEADLKKILTEVLTAIRARRGIMEPVNLDSSTIDYDGEDEINWTVIGDLMGNKRSRIQCRYKWNKMKQQKARSGGVPLPKRPAWKKTVTKVDDMLPGDNIWLLKQIIASGARAERMVPWDDIASIEGTWSPKELRKAYKKLRSALPNTRLPVPDVAAKVLSAFEGLSGDIQNQRFNPPNPASVNPASSTRPSQSPPTPVLPEQQFDEAGFAFPEPPPVIPNVAPVASMGIAAGEYNPAPVGEDMALVDPELIGQGIEQGVQQDLEKTAGKAIMIAAAAAARQRERSGEDVEMELRRRLGEAV